MINHQVDRQKVDRGCSGWIVAGDQCEGVGELAQPEHMLGGGYVDDGAYSYAHHDPAVLSHVLTYKFNKLKEWLNANKLLIYPDKTHLIVMAGKNKKKRKEVSMMAGGSQ